jgi:hypothetical protein
MLVKNNLENKFRQMQKNQITKRSIKFKNQYYADIMKKVEEQKQDIIKNRTESLLKEVNQ